MITFYTKSFQELTHQELYALLQLRSEVFVVEQNSVFLDIDGLDEQAHHVLGFYKNKLVAYARIFSKNVTYPEASIGRVVTHNSVRKLGFGKLLMQYSIQEIQRLYSTTTIMIGAQCYLKKFYNELEFIEEGEMYLEDGIEHITMRYNK